MSLKSLLIFTIAAVLTSCVGSNVLTYHRRPYFKEHSSIQNDSVFKLYQNACYNRPQMIDEEFCYELSFTFLDTIAAKSRKKLNLQTDTTIVQTKYGMFSVWNWSDENNRVSGEIEILHWNAHEIKIKEKVIATDFRREETKKFKGTRTFTSEVEK